MKDFYKILGIGYGADIATIKKAYKKLALIYHPDVNKAADAQERFVELNEAYETLIDPNSRLSYDIALKAYYSSQQQHQSPTKPTAPQEKEESGSGYSWVIYWLIFAALRLIFSNIGSNNTSEHNHNESTKAELPLLMQDNKQHTSPIIYNTAQGNNNNTAPSGNTVNIFSGKPEENQ